MNVRSNVTAFVLASLFAVTAIAANDASQQPARPADGAGAMGMHEMPQAGMGMREMPQGGMAGMMGSGAMDTMRMMDACRHMSGARGAMPGMPKLPPGNEKLQLQMQAEMMQKMGEILSRYAARLPDRPGSAR